MFYELPRRIAGIEKWFYFAPPLNGIFWGLLAVAFNVENAPENYYATNFCTVQYDLDFSKSNGPDDKAYKFQTRVVTVLWALFATMYLSIILLNIVCIRKIYNYVKETEMKSMRWQTANASQLVKTAEVATQFRYFAMVFFIPGTIFVIVYVVNRAGGGKLIPGPYLSFTLLLVCSAGFLNSLVYFRLRYKKLRKETPSARGIESVWKIIQDVLFPCCKPCCVNKNVEDTFSLTDFSTDDDNKDCEPVLEDFVEPPPSIRVPPGASDWKSLRALGVNTVQKRNQLSSQKNDWKSLKALGVNTIGSKAESPSIATSLEQSDNATLSQTTKYQNVDNQRHQSELSESFDRPDPVHGNDLFPVKDLDADELKNRRSSIRILNRASIVLGLEHIQDNGDIDNESDGESDTREHQSLASN